MTPRISFRNVSKAYRLGMTNGSLRDALADCGRRIAGRGKPDDGRILKALDRVSFDIGEGEVVGIIGPNGAGKTTILKLISRITRPTSGLVGVRGCVSALIELGAGFHPDLSGRDNVFLNAAILGMPLKEVSARFDDIVEFAGLGQFIDTPVKRYSSGMYVRLAFAVAAHVRTDILLVDEVLAVGDAQFRQRCLRRIRELRKDGVTIVFVSHHMYLIETVCDRSIFLAEGRIREAGPTTAVLNAYEEWRCSQPAAGFGDLIPSEERFEDATVQITRLEMRDGAGCLTSSVESAGAAEVWVHYRTARRIRKPNLYLKVLGKDGTCCMLRTADYGIVLDDLEGAGTIRVVLDPLQLTPGAYALHAELLEGPDCVILSERFSPLFHVPGSEVGHEGVFVPSVARAIVAHDAGVPESVR